LDQQLAGMASQKSISSFFPAPKRLKVTEATAKDVDPSSDSSTLAEVNDENARVTEALTNHEETDAVFQGETVTEVPESQETGLPDLSQEQKVRMELNKSIARAKRNLKVCEEHVAGAKG